MIETCRIACKLKHFSVSSKISSYLHFTGYCCAVFFVEDQSSFLLYSLPTVDADEVHRFFDDKMAAVRSSTTDASPPMFSTIPIGCVLRCFRPLTAVDVIAAVRLLPDRQCTLDSLSTRLPKYNIDLLAAYLVELFNQSLQQGVVPSAFKDAFITPLLDLNQLLQQRRDERIFERRWNDALL